MSDFLNFIVNNNIVGITIGTIIAFSINNFIDVLKKDHISGFLVSTGVGNTGLISSLAELVILTIIVYIAYRLSPVSRIKQEKRKQMDDWRDDILSQLTEFNRTRPYNLA